MNLLIVLFTAWLSVFSFQPDNPPAPCKNRQYIVAQSKLKDDTDQRWNQSEFRLHIQEPRVNNPQRYSRVVLNNASSYFEIERNRSEGTIKRIIDERGSFRALFNDNTDVPAEIIEKYGINQQRSQGYRNFYQAMYGLPMSVTKEFYDKMAPAEPIVFEGKEAYRISLELKQEMISKHWQLIISIEDYALLALEFYHPENPEEGEIIKFQDNLRIDNITLPRMRHWYDKQTDEYLGSDIIVTETSQDSY